MRAVVSRQPGELVVAEVPEPKPGPGQAVLFDVSGAGTAIGRRR